MKFSTLAVALFASTTLVSADHVKKLMAKFNFKDSDDKVLLDAKVRVFQNKYLENNNAAVWKVKIHHFNKDLCPSGELNWHVHQYEGEGIRTVAEGEADPSSSAPACGGTVTGGHYDPTFACGGASQNNAGAGPPDADGNPTTGGVCAILRDAEQTFPASSAETGKVKTSTAASYAAACNGTPDTQSVCEIGDQSGKLGKLKANKKKISTFRDQWMTPIDTLKGRSLVLHCCYDKPEGGTSCGPRLACANLE